MEYIEVYKTSNIEWKPSPVVALSTSIDESLVAAAREDGSLELWLVSPGSVGWHCQLTIQGNPDSRVSSLVWCHSGSKSMPSGRLLSSSIDGSISEWDFYTLKQKVLLESIGSSIWQMAVEPLVDSSEENGDPKFVTNGCTQYRVNAVDDDDDHSGESSDDDSIELQDYGGNTKSQRLAIGCDDGRVCIYAVSDIEGLTYFRSLPCVSGRTLSVAWSVDAKRIFSGSSDGFIRCWDVKSALEVYRITVGLGGLGSGRELCVWSLLTLRCGTLVSGDSNGSVQFWDTRHGTLLQAHCYHKADVNALATVPNHNRVFSAGSDGQVILYKLSSGTIESAEEYHHEQDIKKWTYVSYVRVHTHDIRALTLAVPIGREVSLPNEKIHKPRQSMKPVTFDYHKWAHLGIPMLISAGDDAKLFAYSARDFTTFTPHDICPAPQRLPVQLVNNSSINNLSVVLIQCPSSLDILPVHLTNEKKHKNSTRTAKIQLLARVKSKESRRIICSTVSGTGLIFAYSDHVKPSLFELREEIGNGGWTVKKRKLPRNLPFAHSMVFSCDSSHLILAGHDQKLYVVDMKTLELLCTYIPRRKEEDPNLPPSEPPITRMYTSFDGQWLAAINCFGDIYIFNLELERQHWFISRMNGASVTAAGFPPGDSNVLVITTSSNQVFVFDIEAKRLGVWSRKHTYVLPRRFQEFPGDVIGLSFSPSCSTSVIIYSARAMCFVDFSVPIDADDIDLLNDSSLLPPKKTLQELSKTAKMKRKRKDLDLSNKIKSKSNFIFKSFNNPVLFVGHLSESSLLVIEKPWIDVIRTFDAPVHRRIYGT